MCSDCGLRGDIAMVERWSLLAGIFWGNFHVMWEGRCGIEKDLGL